MEVEEHYEEGGQPVEAGAGPGEQTEAHAQDTAVGDGATAAGWYTTFVFPCQPQPIYRATQEYANNSASCPNSNFLKGVKWSPDGACLLTASDDNWLRLYDLPQDVATAPVLQYPDLLPPEEQQGQQEQGQAAGGGGGTCSGSGAAADNLVPALRMHAGETVYDYCWYSRMSALDPVSCCLASTARGHPIQLWDACSGEPRASYRGYNDADEPTAAYSLAFSPDGGRLLGGYNRSIYVFDVTRPGRDYKRIVTHKRKNPESITGIVSCLAWSPGGDVFAAGTYTGGLGVYDGRTYELLLLLSGTKGGLTQLLFSADGNYLYTGARQDPHMLCWDVRHTYAALYSMERPTGHTNQRVQFDIEPAGRHLVTGGCDGCVLAYDLSSGQQVDRAQVAGDTVNGVGLHPTLGLMATASAISTLGQAGVLAK
ncbi:hypothetical protein HYH02_014913 [Chlamydomonas schloesseri]|uniref:Uncharacterized protein n=1 Tax=Chlamydomonas schloesseri TaxID=2026947 RepID=A0A835SPJ7_9CHLO|nr:hypothetical protein HYH02_014913 [Chlamydomonas schloesseri]|eukprot:KAG2425914.1 hypothetical protein HYH02_014913 [Chlamydomonas schloesseri]